MSFAAPKIRFKDDHCNDFPDWEEKKLGEVVTCLDNLRRPVNATEREKMKGDIPYYGANGIQGYVNDFIFDEDLTLLAEDGGNFDEFATRPIAQRVTGKAWVNNHAHILRADPSDMTPAFLFHSLVHKDIRKYINGSSRAKLNKGDMLSIAMTAPDIPEQTKIADFLTAVDRRVEQLTQKKALLEDYKKGVMQQLFTQAIRFKDDHGNDFPDWEEKKLGEVGTTYSGLSGKSGDDFGTGKPFVTYKQIFDNTTIDIQNCGKVAITPQEKQNRVRKGDILFTTSSETRLEVGFTSVVLDELDEVYLNSFCFGFRMNNGNELLTEFARYLFHSTAARRSITVLGQGSTRYNISKNQLMKIMFAFPSLPEQTKIADFLSAIDRKIESVATQITETQTFKKGLLQQMFV
jgi:restriction endonuclease S subunit